MFFQISVLGLFRYICKSGIAGSRMNLDNIMLSEISQSEKDKYHMISLTCGTVPYRKEQCPRSIHSGSRSFLLIKCFAQYRCSADSLPHKGEQSTLLSLWIHVLILYRNTLTDLPKNVWPNVWALCDPNFDTYNHPSQSYSQL